MNARPAAMAEIDRNDAFEVHINVTVDGYSTTLPLETSDAGLVLFPWIRVSRFCASTVSTAQVLFVSTTAYCPPCKSLKSYFPYLSVNVDTRVVPFSSFKWTLISGNGLSPSPSPSVSSLTVPASALLTDLLDLDDDFWTSYLSFPRLQLSQFADTAGAFVAVGNHQTQHQEQKAFEVSGIHCIPFQ